MTECNILESSTTFLSFSGILNVDLKIYIKFGDLSVSNFIKITSSLVERLVHDTDSNINSVYFQNATFKPKVIL